MASPKSKAHVMCCDRSIKRVCLQSNGLGQLEKSTNQVFFPLKTQNSLNALVKEESIDEMNGGPVIHFPQIFMLSVPWQKIKTHVRSLSSPYGTNDEPENP